MKCNDNWEGRGGEENAFDSMYIRRFKKKKKFKYFPFVDEMIE